MAALNLSDQRQSSDDVLASGEYPLTRRDLSEIAAMIGENCFGDLKAPVRRIGSPHVPMPFSSELVKHVVPEKSHVIEAVNQSMAA